MRCWLACTMLIACASSRPLPHEPDPVVPSKRPLIAAPLAPLAWSLVSTEQGVPVTTVAELSAALANKETPLAEIADVAEIRKRDLVLDAAAIGSIKDALLDTTAQTRLESQRKIPYALALKLLLHGYASQLEERFGFVTHEVLATPGRDRVTIVVRGKLAVPGGTVLDLDWRNGAFYPAAVPPPPRPVRTYPPTVVTTIVSERGDYYHVPGIAYPAYFRPRGDEQVSEKLFKGEGLRSIREPVDYVDVGGSRTRSHVLVDGYTPTFILRPGGLARLGLTKPIHLVELTLADTVGNSGTLIEDAKAIDGTPTFPVDLATIFQTVRRQLEGDGKQAELDLDRRIKTVLNDFAGNVRSWHQKTAPSERLETSERSYVQAVPTFTWNPAAPALTISYDYENHVIHRGELKVHNTDPPRSCMPGQPCAQDPEFRELAFEQEYVVRFRATYTIDAKGTLASTKSVPALEVRGH